MSFGNIFVIGVIVGQAMQWISHITTIFRTPYPNLSADGQIMEVTEKLNYWNLFQQLSGHYIMVGMWFALAYVGNDPIIGEPVRVSVKYIGEPNLPTPKGDWYFMWYLIFISMFQVHQTMHMQVAHVTLAKYSAWTRTYIFAFTYLCILFVAVYVRDGDVNTKKATAILVMCIFVAQWHYIINIVSEFSTILNIKVFKVKTQE